MRMPLHSLLFALLLTLPAAATTPPNASKHSNDGADYVALGTSAFGNNGHGSYAWFVDVKTKQVVMCLVHNPQSAIECKRAPLPAP